MKDRKTPRGAGSKEGIQELFFSKLREALPSGIALPEEIADLLHVSLDSAYRRIRGETELTLEEIMLITRKYPLSLDELFGQKGNAATFTYTKLIDSEDQFTAYLTRLHQHLLTLNRIPDAKIFYVADEAPLFYSFRFRKLTEFKLFFWQRSVLNIERYQKMKFERGVVPENIIGIASKSYEEYMKLPGTEVWTDETVLTNLKQIRFYFDSGLVSTDDALDLFSEQREIIQMLMNMAEGARKNVSDAPGTFTMYCSDVVLGTNCIYASAGKHRFSYISFNSVNSLTTNNPDFCDETENWLRNLEKKSTLISGVGEKQRYQFFSRMFRTIDSYVEIVKEYKQQIAGES